MEKIIEIKKEIEALQEKANNLTELVKLYPDLKEYTGRWKKTVYFSGSINESATDYDWRFNCGCCNDSPLEVWPYIKTPYGKVYSDPASFVIGERGYPNLEYPEWQEKLRKSKIPEVLIENMSFLFVKEEIEDE